MLQIGKVSFPVFICRTESNSIMLVLLLVTNIQTIFLFKVSYVKKQSSINNLRLVKRMLVVTNCCGDRKERFQRKKRIKV